MKLSVSHIQRYSLHDGPGIRTTIFLSGCTLRCAWCHNPETISPYPVLQYFRSKCVSCGACVRSCPRSALEMRDGIVVIDKKKCSVTGCGICSHRCPSSAICVNGRSMDVDEMMRVILRDKEFYSVSGGGVTVSGGEPLLQASGVAELLKLCRGNGLNTAVDTAGFVPFERFESVAEYTDLFLFDLKLMDPKKHAEYVGADNGLILDNFGKLYDMHGRIAVRVPVIPGLNTSAYDIRLLAEFLKRFPSISAPEFIPMHKMAKAKYESLGIANSFFQEYNAPNEELMDEITEMYNSIKEERRQI